MFDEKIENIIGQFISQPLPQNCKREYKEFSTRLDELSKRKVVYINDFLDAIDTDDDMRISLCTFDRALQEVKIDSVLDMIYLYRENIMQVFMHPKIHLKETQQVLPIEVVKRVGHESIRHLASHSEHWESVRVSGLVPARLLARTLEDEYAIYENVVAKNLVDKLYTMMLRKRKELKIIAYNFDAKESIYSLSNQQPNVYAAYTALFKGYSDNSLQDVKKVTAAQLQMIEEILANLAVCRESSLYSRLKKVPMISGQLKPTNIFLMDKHYKYIYKLWKELMRIHIAYADEDKSKDDSEITDEYFKFTFSTMIFALNHFNFQQTIDCTMFSENGFNTQEYSFEKWKCSIEELLLSDIGQKGLVCNTSINKEYICDIENIVNSDLGTLPARIQGDKLIISRIISEAEQDSLCDLIYPDIPGSNWTVKNARKALRQVLKQKLWRMFHGQKKSEYKTLILPLCVQFKDCSVDARKAIDSIFHAITRDIQELNINAVYIVTPFSPFEYSHSENIPQSDAKQLFHYAMTREDSDVKLGVLPISISDVNSYRRFTKILLLSMMEICDEIDICPICGQPMYKDKSGTYICYSCSYEIMETKCGDCGHYYYNSRFPLSKVGTVVDNDVAYKLLVSEIKNSFKNLVDIDMDTNKYICPYCNTQQV
jgi:hypothetical protein